MRSILKLQRYLLNFVRTIPLVQYKGIDSIKFRTSILDSLLEIGLDENFESPSFFLTSPFSFQWYLHLILTGACLACATGVKMVGLFTVACIGVATLIDLWRLLDFQRGLTVRLFGEFLIPVFLPFFFLFLIPNSVFFFCSF